MFCQKKTHKKSTLTNKVSTFDSALNLLNVAKTKSDDSMVRNIEDVDLVAAEALYHPSCKSKYVSKRNIQFQCLTQNLKTQYI